MGTYVDTLEKSLLNFQRVTENPEVFLELDDTFVDSIKCNLKEIYDFTKAQEIASQSKGLTKLLIDKFDTEQIWQQIDLQNNDVLSKSLNTVTRLVVNKNKLIFSNLTTNEEGDDEVKCEANSTSDNTDHIEEQNIDEINEDDDNESNNDEDMEAEDSNNVIAEEGNPSKDNFFNLEEMENFLNNEDKKFNQPEVKNGEEESDSDEESINLFEEDDDDNEDEEEDKSRLAKFKDFFKSNQPQKKDNPKRNKFLDELSENENDEEPKKSSLELRQERLKKRIEEIEENAISEKPWALKGEIRAENRPQNSLLEEVLEFDVTSRPAPIITENTSFQLEDIIRQRIKDKVFDSVIRKEKPIETPLEYKKKLTLDQEKSKHSLAQIYEKEFLDQQAALDPSKAEQEEEEPALHKEIKTMMNQLFNKLDALSNFHFTPKPALPELRVINNLPAISMEEVAPVTASEVALLAPEEIKNKLKGDILGDSEKTKTDKNRSRRKKKLKQKHHKEVISKTTKMGDVLKNRNTQKMEETSGKSLKSSKAFFTQLQDQAQAHINKKLETSGKKKDKNKINARKVKL